MNIIPLPQQITQQEGQFALSPDTRIYFSPGASSVAEYLSGVLPIKLEITETAHDQTLPGSILLSLMGAGQSQGTEGYNIKVSPTGVILRANQPAGLFYGVQTLRQLCYPSTTLPAVEIIDKPRFSWRGLMLDVGRHIYPFEYFERLIDAMALHKLNILHWHLTEDQGWRIEIKKYPKLTEVGAYRSATPLPAYRDELDGTPYGGFYTQEQIRQVVAYAASRHITVVPEIEMPGHSVAALASYPDLGCTGGPYAVRTFWGIEEDVYCAGNEQTFTFLQDVLDEVLELFPSEFIHIGGDECPKERWKQCPKCQATIQANGLQDEHELQSYFIRRIETYLNQNGRRLIGWDEILEGGLAPNASVMSWRGMEGGLDAARQDHDVVMTPTEFCYLDYYQVENIDQEPPAIGGYIPLEKAYAFEPAPSELNKSETERILGLQGNLWTEYISSPEHAEYMLFPRLTALAEVAWSLPARRDFTDFKSRLENFLPILRRTNICYRPLGGMKTRWIMSPAEHYARMNEYILSYGLPWDLKDMTDWETFLPDLTAILDQAEGRRVLDCACGWGRQAIPLAKLGWQVTATDISPTSLDFARKEAVKTNVDIDFRLLDIRQLADSFNGEFDWVVSGYALYELDNDEDIQQTVNGMFYALKPEGQCYIILRDMDNFMEDPVRHQFHGERRYENKRIFCIQDMEYESRTHLIMLYAFMVEDETKDQNDWLRWRSETIGIRKRILYKSDLVHFFIKAGFDPVKILPKPYPWMDVELVATKPVQSENN